MDKRYLVLQRIWHTGEGRYCVPGERVGLGHLDGEGIERLVEQGVVVGLMKEKAARRLKSKSLEEVEEDGTSNVDGSGD